MLKQMKLVSWPALKKYVHLHLILGGIGIFLLLLIPTLTCGSCNRKSMSSSSLAISLSSMEVRISGVALFVSACPTTLDLIMDLIYKYSFLSKLIIQWRISKIASNLVTLLFGLQVALGYDYFHVTGDYTLSYWFAIWSFRIVLITSIMSLLHSLNPFVFLFTEILSLSIITIVCCAFIFFSLANQYEVINVFGTISIYFLLCAIVAALIIWIARFIKQKRKIIVSVDNVTCIYLLIILAITSLSIFFNLLSSWSLGYGYFNPQDSHLWNVLLQIYTHVFCSIVMSTFPNRILRIEAIESKDRIIERKQAYVSYISHELRTPLNTVFMGLKLCHDIIPTTTTSKIHLEMRDTLLEVAWAGEIALEVLNEFLLFDKLQNGLVTLAIENFNILEYLSKCINMFTVQLKSKKLQLQFNIANSGINIDELSTQDMVEADKSKLGQVLRNVLSNAIKFTPDGGNICILVSFQQLSDDFILPLPDKSAISYSHSFSRLNITDSVADYHHHHRQSPSSNGDGVVDNSLWKHTSNLKNMLTALWSIRQGSALFNNKVQDIDHSVPISSKYDISGSNIQGGGVGLDIDDHDSSESMGIDIQQEYTGGNEEYPLLQPFPPAPLLSSSVVVNPDVSLYAFQKGMLVIEIKDSGFGISVENQKRLFSEIIQFKPEVSQGGGGSGLGLYISKRIVDLHGGKISVHSEGEGKGTMFRVEIPMIKSVQIESTRPDDSMELSGHSHEKRPTFGRMQSFTDRPTLRNSINASMRSWSNSSSKKDSEPILSNNSPYRRKYSNSVLLNQSNGGDMVDGVRRNSISNSTNDETTADADKNIYAQWNFNESLMDVSAIDTTTTTTTTTTTSSSNNVSIPSSSIVTQASAMGDAADYDVNSPIVHVKDYDDDNDDDDNDNENKIALSAGSNDANSIQPSLMLLIVDDSALNRKMLKRLLETQGHVCEQAEDGLMAVKMVKSKVRRNDDHNDSSIVIVGNELNTAYYDSIIMDYNMPNMNGPTAATEIRKLGYAGSIIGVTGNFLDKDKDMFMKAGASHVFTKPLDISLITTAFQDFKSLPSVTMTI